MNREIKFRLWDNLKKEILFEGFNVFGEVTLFNGIGNYAYETKGQRSSLERYNDFEIMQFTGLKDKNGKDIYEGDILKSWYSRDLSMKDIVYTQEVVKYEIEQYSGEAGFEILFPERAEIIGNIFQNPKLLETVQK